MRKSRLVILAAQIIFISLACNMERVLNPSLPTSTPSREQGDNPGVSTSPIPTIAPIPQPRERIVSGDLALSNGDWEKALFEFSQALEKDQSPEIQAAGLLGIGKTFYEAQQFANARDNLLLVIERYPESLQTSQAYFILGETYNALDRHSEAAAAYQEYVLRRSGIIDYYIYSRIGNSLMAANDSQNAINAYLLAQQAPHLGDSITLDIKIGDAYSQQNELPTAIITYQDIFNRTNNDFIKAQMKLKTGNLYAALGQNSEAYAEYQFALNNYPLANSSYLALIELVNAEVPVDELNRGLADYFAGQYGVAVSAFDRYLNANPDTHDDTAHFYKGLSFQSTGQYQAALDEWNELIRDHPNGRFWAETFDEIAFTQWVHLDQYDLAIETLVDFVDRSSEHPDAPEWLFFAGRIAERDHQLARAANLWSRLGAQFPSSSWGFEGFFQAGIANFRLGDYPTAKGQFQSALVSASNPSNQSKAHFWIGKSSFANGENDSAFISWQQAASLDPTGYYSERAKDTLNGVAGFTIPSNFDPTFNINSELIEASAWVKVVFSLPGDTDLSDPGPLRADPRFIRGTELWQLGLLNAARIEFESLRVEVQNDPANTFRLANYLIEIGLYRSGIIAARQVLNLADLDDAGTLTAPIYFNHIRFGFYFNDVVFPAAQSYNIPILFYYSVLRQESLYEGFVTSTAGARGLMQIIPSTGESIYSRNGWPIGYTSEDLYRPLVNITYGADYLNTQRTVFGGDLYAALAAYNGGPGNASAWLDLANGDPDLFVEVIRFAETRRYLRSIYEQFTIFRDIYSQSSN